MRAEADYADDAVLVDALREGDEAAFSWLLSRYDGPLHRLAATFVSSRAVADEVVQETWLAVIQGIDRFEARSSVKTWLYRILMNTARSRGAHESRSVPFGDDEPSFAPDRFRSGGVYAGHWSAPPEPWDEQPTERLLAAETLGLVRDAIERLPDRQRTVITLRDIDGCSSSEICELLDLTEANQRVLLHRARAHVRRALDDYFTSAES